MHPRTLAIVAVTLLAGSFVMRYVVVRFALLPISEEVVLKQATSIGVTFPYEGKTKTVHIADPAEVQELLAALKLRDSGKNPWMYSGGHMQTQTEVHFYFPNGFHRGHMIQSPDWFADYQWEPAFFTKLAETVSRHEGRVVNLMQLQPPAPPQPPPVAVTPLLIDNDDPGNLKK